MKLALLIANRGFFPSSVISSAREEMTAAMKRAGVEPVYPNLSSTRYGAVETTAEGMVFADFLADHRGEYDGLVICLPNFGDENGIKAAIADCDVPILLQAYPDQLDEMGFEHRRDAFCGKMALTSVLTQMKKPYTTFLPFTVHPSTAAMMDKIHSGDFDSADSHRYLRDCTEKATDIMVEMMELFGYANWKP